MCTTHLTNYKGILSAVEKLCLCQDTEVNTYPQLKKIICLSVSSPGREFSSVLSPSTASMNKNGILGLQRCLYISLQNHRNSLHVSGDAI